MKPLSIPSLLLIYGLFTPLLPAQDESAKVREIEQKVLQKQYLTGVGVLVGSAREGGGAGASPELIGKRAQWLTLVGNQIEGAKKASDADQEQMTENAGTLNELAWNMITSPDANSLHPEIALKLADIAIELAGEDTELKPKVLDTKARALFLLGRHQDAITEQEKAVAAATVAEDKAGFETTLAAYRMNELPESSSPADGPDGLGTTFRMKELAERLDVLRKRVEDFTKSNPEAAGGDAARAGAEMQDRIDELFRPSKLRDLEKLKDGSETAEPSSGAAYITEKLRRIVIPRIEFEDTSVEEAIDFLRRSAAELDITELDPAKKGINFVIRRPRLVPTGAADAGAAPAAPGAQNGLPDAAGDPGTLRIKELRLRNVPLAVALKYICDQTKLRYKVDDFAVTLVPQMDTDIFTRNFSVPPDFLFMLDSGSGTKPDPGRTIIEWLKSAGINFGEGTSAALSASGVLLVTNTPGELDKVEQLVSAATVKSEWTKKQTTTPGAPVKPDAR